MEIIVRQQLGAAKREDIGMDPAPLKITSQVARASLRLGKRRDFLHVRQNAALVDSQAGKGQGPVEVRPHRLIAVRLSAITRGAHCLPYELQDMRAIPLRVLAVCKSIIDPDPLRHRPRIDHLRCLKEKADLRVGQTVGRVAECAGDRLKLPLREKRHPFWCLPVPQ